MRLAEVRRRRGRENVAGAFELAPGDLSVAVRVEMIEVTGQEGNPPGFIASDLSIAICIGRERFQDCMKK